MVFKGGTSLSKAYGVIHRFSEDVDPTYDMRAERTFWEKTTAIHVFCAQGSFRGGARYARHRHDVTRLDDAGFADRAAADRELALAAAGDKAVLFAESTPDGEPIDYLSAVSGALELAPRGHARLELAEDYARMRASQ